MTAIIGHRSTIAKAYRSLIDDQGIGFRIEATPLDWTEYLICMGYLAGKQVEDLTSDEIDLTWHKNFALIATFCDELFARNDSARVCIITSESGYAGSYDLAYAGAKAAMNLYIERKQLRTPAQQLVGIAPTVIRDSGMTNRRQDIALCDMRGAARRRGRWLSAMEVARVAHFVLHGDTDAAICNTVIRVTGGNS